MSNQAIRVTVKSDDKTARKTSWEVPATELYTDRETRADQPTVT